MQGTGLVGAPPPELVMECVDKVLPLEELPVCSVTLMLVWVWVVEPPPPFVAVPVPVPVLPPVEPCGGFIGYLLPGNDPVDMLEPVVEPVGAPEPEPCEE